MSFRNIFHENKTFSRLLQELEYPGISTWENFSVNIFSKKNMKTYFSMCLTFVTMVEHLT